MKRVIQRKAKQGICDELLDTGNSLKKRKRASQDIGNKTKTSAAMLGLALSFGASGSILSCHNKRAMATEPPAEGISSVQSEPDSISEGSNHVEGSHQTVSHVIREGETLWTLADSYGVSSDILLGLNGFEDDIVLSVGQTIQVPSGSEPKRQEVSVPMVVQVESVQAHTVPQSHSSGVDGEAIDNLAQLQLKETSIDVSESDSVPVKQVDPELELEGSTLSAVAPSDNISQADVELSEAVVEAEMAVKPAIALVDHPDVIALNDDILPASAPQDVPNVSSSSVASSISVSVDRPLLVAESVAFSNMPNADEASSISAPNINQQPISAPANDGTHQIQVGETLADIAGRYGISTQQLAEANGIRNPNRIFAGRVLNLPSDAVSGSRVQQRERVPQVISSDVVVVGTVDSGSDVLAEEVQVASVTTQSDGVVPGDFYVQRLLNEIEGISAEYQASEITESSSVNVAAAIIQSDGSGVYTIDGEQDEVSVTISSPSDDSSSESDIIVSESGTEIAASDFNPQFSVIEADSAIDSVAQPTPIQSGESAFEETQLIAAAPLGSENYVPLSQPVTERMVSPELPPLLEPENYLPTSPGQFNGYTYPAQGALTSGYGWRWGRMHRGIDVAAPIGTPIVAAAPGVIEFAGWNSGGYGNMVDIRHPDGSRTRYAHNNRNLVRVGQRVAQGEQIAEMGSTGYSTGPHVHFEIHLPEQGTVNPIAYLVR